jgi:Spy/CpxP family protein refolding chaperone
MGVSDSRRFPADRMNPMKFFVPALLLAALALPLGVCAQQSDQPAQTPPQPSASAGRSNMHIYRRWSKLLSGVNLTDQQHARIQQLLDQYSDAHPPGSPFDRQATRELRDQIFSVLTPDQQTQVKQQARTIQAQRQRHLQQQQQQQNPSQLNPQPAPTA